MGFFFFFNTLCMHVYILCIFVFRIIKVWTFSSCILASFPLTRLRLFHLSLTASNNYLEGNLVLRTIVFIRKHHSWQFLSLRGYSCNSEWVTVSVLFPQEQGSCLYSDARLVKFQAEPTLNKSWWLFCCFCYFYIVLYLFIFLHFNSWSLVCRGCHQGRDVEPFITVCKESHSSSLSNVIVDDNTKDIYNMHEFLIHYAENTIEEIGQAYSCLWSASMPVLVSINIKNEDKLRSILWSYLSYGLEVTKAIFLL